MKLQKFSVDCIRVCSATPGAATSAASTTSEITNWKFLTKAGGNIRQLFGNKGLANFWHWRISSHCWKSVKPFESDMKF